MQNETIDSMLNRVAKNIKKARLNMKLSQVEMAELVGYTERTWRRFETYGTQSLEVIINISNTCHIETKDILYGDVL